MPDKKLVKAGKHQLMTFMRHGHIRCQACVVSNECPEFRDDEEAICVLIPRHRARLKAAVMELPQIQPEDEFLVEEFTRVKSMLDIIDLYVSRKGIIEGNALQPVLDYYSRLLAHFRGLAKDLKMTPATRGRITRKSFAEGMVEAEVVG